MQDYYYAPDDDLIIEIGRDDWISSPRENKNVNNVFSFLTWEDDGTPSPDTNRFKTMGDFIDYLKVEGIDDIDRGFQNNAMFGLLVCKDEWDELYEIASGYDKKIVGVIYQTRKELKERCHEDWRERALRELKSYNQYICGEVFFVNVYDEGKLVAYNNSVYDRDRLLSKYNRCVPLGFYDSLNACLFDNLRLIKNKKSGFERVYKDGKEKSKKKVKSILEFVK